MAEISGIKLKDLAAPIHDALARYQELSQGALTFDLDEVGDLALTSDKPNSARSVTDVKSHGASIGKLFVIAFKPEDGTGDESAYKLDDLVMPRRYPALPKIVPRSKAGTNQEAHMALVSQRIDDVHADQQMYGGAFDLIGLNGRLIKKIGELGHPIDIAAEDLSPITTLTVGYDPNTGERFGDPHAVYNPNRTVQVAGFLAISDEIYKSHPEILAGFKPQKPRTP